MKNFLQRITLSLLAIIFITDLQAQRREDHFFRRTTVNRLDLEEKINFALVRPGNPYVDANSEFSYTQGIVDAIFKGMKSGQYMAYDPNDINLAMNYHELEANLRYQDGLMEEPLEGEETWGEESEWPEDDWDNDDLSEYDDFEGEDFEAPGNEFEGQFDQRSNPDELDMGSYTMAIQFVEDWIFDKNTSSLRFDIRYFQVIWVDPAGTLPDKMMAVYRWEDIAPVMAKTQWPNRFNDAENRSVKEVFDMRIFNSFLIDVSGNGMKSLDEADRWRRKLVEKEHHLYSY